LSEVWQYYDSIAEFVSREPSWREGACPSGSPLERFQEKRKPVFRFENATTQETERHADASRVGVQRQASLLPPVSSGAIILILS
jgi:hypothetical protein